MQKLIKLSNYYYVVDDKAEIKDLGEYYIDNDEPNKVVKIKHKFHLQQVNYGILKSECAKVIATTNPLVNTFMILDIDKELIDKEVQVTFERVYFEKESTIIAIIKPISKETSTNETLEEVAWKKYNTKTQEDEGLRDAFIAGYKHCEKTMYSEEELRISLLRYQRYLGYPIVMKDFEEWFKQHINNKK